MKYFFPILLIVYNLSIIIFSRVSNCNEKNVDLENILLKPSLTKPFGTDELGRDIICRTGVGLVNSLEVSLISLTISLSIGAIIGVFSGYFRTLDFILIRVIEFFQGFPSLIFVIFIVSIFGGDKLKTAISLSVFGWTAFARISRSETFKFRSAEFVEAAKTLGASNLYIIFKHIIPHIIPAVLTQAFFSFASFVLIEGSLGFLGLLPSDYISLGKMVADGIDFILVSPHIVFFPGLSISTLSLFSNLVGQRFIK